jgi:hypothetical protein
VTGLFLAAALALAVPAPPTVVTLKDADVAQVASLLSLPAYLKPKLVGRVGLIQLTIRGTRFELTTKSWRIPGDPIKSLTAKGDWKAGTVSVKAEVLGGLLEYEGRLP